MAGKRDRETVVQGVVRNIGIDSFIDDLSSVDSKGLPYQDYEVPMIQTVQKTMDVPQLQFLNKVDDTPVALQRQTSMVQNMQEVPQMQVVEKTAEGPQLQIVEQTVETSETQMIQCTQTSESLGTAPVCRVTQAKVVEAVEIGTRLPAELGRPVFVTAPVLENPPVVVECVQSASVAGCVEPAPAVTFAHAAPVVEFVTPAYAVACATAVTAMTAFIDKVVDIPVVVQRQIPMVQTEQKILEISQSQCLHRVVDVLARGAKYGRDLTGAPGEHLGVYRRTARW